MRYLVNVRVDGLTGEGFANLRNEHDRDLEFWEGSAFPGRALLRLAVGEQRCLLVRTVDIHFVRRIVGIIIYISIANYIILGNENLCT